MAWSRMAGVAPSATKAMTARAAALKAAGKSIITLSQGEPDFDTPAEVRFAAIEAIVAGKTRYTAVPGIADLREAIAAKFLEDNALTFSIDEIIVGCGAKQVLFNALFVTLSPGDEVVIPAPCWVSYPEIVRLVGGVPVIVPCSAADGFKLTPQALERALTPRTRWLMLNSPTNPTGAVYSADELRALADVLARNPDVWILSDDIYEALVYGDVPFATMAAVAPSLAERTLTVNGVSKAYAMTGWRVGYGAGPKELIRAMSTVQGHMSSHTSSISQHAAVRALRGGRALRDVFRERFRARRDLLAAEVNGIPGLSCAVPEGAFYLFTSCAPLIGATTPGGQVLRTDEDIALHLLDAGVAVVPGSGFLASPFLRLSFASSEADLMTACERIRAACAALVLPPAAH